MFNDLFRQIPENYQALTSSTLFILFVILPLFVPIVLFWLAWTLWRRYKRFLFRTKQDRILLEIKPPREVRRSPLAMELFLNVLNQGGGEGTWYDRNFLGKSRTWFSLELVSVEGNIKFFIWTEKRFKNLIESQLYAQYPTVEISESDDYSKFVDLDFNKIKMFGCEFILSKADPYPIKTYIDYGMDKVGAEEEEKIDPMMPVIEYLGSLGKGEQMWLQIMIRTHKKEKRTQLGFVDVLKKRKLYDEFDWTKEAEEEKKKILEKLKADKAAFPRMATKGEMDTISAIERNVDKPAFDCGIRGIYLAEKDKYNAINVTGILGTFKQYNSVSLNGFKPNNGTSFDFPWQDFRDYRVNKKKREIFGNYKRRNYFYYPERADKQFVLSSEELATIFHLPGGVIQTPSLKRVVTKKGEPPVNLPF